MSFQDKRNCFLEFSEKCPVTSNLIAFEIFLALLCWFSYAGRDQALVRRFHEGQGFNLTRISDRITLKMVEGIGSDLNWNPIKGLPNRETNTRWVFENLQPVLSHRRPVSFCSVSFNPTSTDKNNQRGCRLLQFCLIHFG